TVSPMNASPPKTGMMTSTAARSWPARSFRLAAVFAMADRTPVAELSRLAPFRQHEPDESDVAQIPPPQPARFPHEPPHPLEPGLLHPDRRPPDAPGEKVEGCADADGNGNPVLAIAAIDPFLLLRRPEADQQNVRPGFPD